MLLTDVSPVLAHARPVNPPTNAKHAQLLDMLPTQLVFVHLNVVMDSSLVLKHVTLAILTQLVASTAKPNKDTPAQDNPQYVDPILLLFQLPQLHQSRQLPL